MFSTLSAYAGDPILSLQLAYRDDPRPEKINLSIGLYYDEQGHIPRLPSVQEAAKTVNASTAPCVYLPMSGSPPYCRAAQGLVFGADSAAVQAGKVATIQTVGGSGALKVGADVLRRFFPDSTVRISGPTWDNHRAIFEGAGFTVDEYPYFDRAAQRLDFDAMAACLRTLPPRTVVLLHPCCHNPTGAELSTAQWDEVIKIVIEQRLIPFLDMAYQGLGEGFDRDAYLVRALASANVAFLVANSFSKIFSLYGERCGSLSMVCANADEASRALGQMQQAVRRNYSSPPLHGAQLVETVLLDPALRAMWEAEVTEMRTRIHAMRGRLHEGLVRHHPDFDWDFLLAQSGMFSYAPALAPHMDRLMQAHGVYIIESGRICIAGLNTENVDRVAQAFASVLKESGGVK
ncbi:MAG TPA: amino acid aminotransferase [Pusillimonas sp.]|uniref:amino acid aminotransferase n=1 Tax=Pusillimonas sp. TaxID=3040095 RepID=UPI002CAFFAE2|nr:amino acid aminotransferase [Pusillimonas sp.]HUH86546.1 amino acid aminotransferase [Pusillimonas sp.]